MSNTSFINAKQSALKKYFSRMNDMQQQAVFTVNGPLLVLAGAGSGKTTVIVNRIANMINFGNAFYDDSRNGSSDDIDFLIDYANGKTDDFDTLRDITAIEPVKPWNILAITFTNKAAGELKERLSAMLGEDALNITAATFHSACVRILRREIQCIGYSSDFTIYDSDDSQRMLKAIMAESDVSEKQFAPRAVLNEISMAKDKMLSPEDMLRNAGIDYRKKIIARLYSIYQTRMQTANALDFDDIILLTVKIFEQFPDVLEKYQKRYKYIMVDEYQDTNHVQFRLVSLLSKAHNNICVVGDDDQSIYKFRGANIENILGFENQFNGARVIRLEQNYRSTQTILDAANSVISHNAGRKDKSLWTEHEKGSPIYWYKAFDETDEANFIVKTISASFKKSGKYSNNAVLYRMNAQSNIIERCLVRAGIPYKVYGGIRFYDRKEIKDITAYMSFINNPSDMLRFRRIINEPKRGIGDATLALLEDMSRDLKISPLEIMHNAHEYGPLAKKATSLKNTAAIFDELIELAEVMPLDEFFDELLVKTGYAAYLKSLGDEGAARLENVEELRSTIVSYMNETDDPSINEFLEEVALYTEADRDDGSEDRVTLMTVHSAKGLEFENVFITGLEDGIFPGSRSLDSEEDLEEERRLAYVAITRAKSRLYLTSAKQRLLYGQTQHNITSRFIREIGSELIEKHDNAAAKNTASSNTGSIAAVHSATLQQQLARNKIMSESAAHPFIEYSVGDRVTNKVFGEGTILSVTKTLNDAMLEVAFDKVGTKKVMATYVKPGTM